MNDEISVFKGIQSKPIDTTTWQDTLERIKSDRYRDTINKARSIVDLDQYREFKKKMPAVTFCGKFKGSRKKANIDLATGFIIPDLDHLEDVEAVFELLAKDENIWFAFRSPSGEGIKCGIRAEDIRTDDDIKVFYTAVERYLRETYSITIDPACKDISRLTFVSYDPNLWINPDPYFFDISAWAEASQPQSPAYDPSLFHNSTGKQKYARKVLESCCDKIRQSQPGTQHNTRLRMARLIGGYINYLDESEILTALEQAVKDSGAKYMGQAMKTVKDGLNYGKQNPLVIDDISGDITYYCDIDEISKQSKQSKQGHANSSKVSRSKQDSSKVSRSKQSVGGESGSDFDGDQPGTPADAENFNFGTDNAIYAHAHAPARAHDKEKQKYSSNNKEGGFPPPQNLAAHIKEWITAETGSFTTDQIDREFCLTTRREKNNRAKILSHLVNENLIKRDKKIKGKYHILDTTVDWIDLDEDDPETFPLALPFDLHEYVKIPPKAIILLAGSTNAGKTAIVLNTLRLNIHHDYPKLYLMSEMGSGEYKSRIKSFGDSLDYWKQIKAASKSYDFNSTIQHYNKDGLTCIDYLEEIDGEYFKIASNIRDVYDSLRDGVAFIAIQKKTSSEFGRGGEATKEKARLCLTLDYIATQENAIVCALKVTKVKHFLKKNLQNYEIHFRLTRGCQITPLTDWMPSSKVNRQQMAAQYEAGVQIPSQESDDHIYFRTDKGNLKRVTFADAEKWAQTFTNIDVVAELERIGRDSFNKPFIKDSGWYHQLSGILRKKNGGS